ncbi:MAG: CHAT domain-containing protein [Roseiflexaceae bacterium]
MFTDYAECEIEIQPRNGDVYPFSLTAPGGDARGALRLPTEDAAYQALAARLDALDTDEEALAAIGRTLFEALFQGQAREVYARSQGMLRAGQGLRIKLCIAASEAEVAALPWELLYDPDQGPLALLDAPIVRYLPQPTRLPILHTDLPLRVLLTAAQTPPAADVTRELSEIQAALATLGEHVQVAVEPHLTTVRLQRLLREGFHVWHFVGHSAVGKDGSSGQLLFRGVSGAAEPVSAAQLGIMLNRSGVRLVALDTCEDGRLATGPLHGIAHALVRAQIPAVVAMQFSAPEEAARAFAGEFYRALAEGFPIDACVTEGRKAVMGAAGLGRADWSTPAVYTGAPDGRLFELPPRADIPGAIVAVLGEGYARVTISSAAGTLLGAARPPAIERLAHAPRPPRPPRGFRDREEEQQELLPELEPGRGAWLRGPPGSGRSALLRQAANSAAARALPDGILYINEQIEPSSLDDIAQGLFSAFYASDTTVRVAPELARTYLGGLRALFMLDRLPLNSDELVELADILAGGAMLITADGAAPDTLLELALGGLPRAEAVALCAAEMHLSIVVPQIASLLDRLCAALGDLPLPLLLAGRLVQKGLAPLERLVAVLDEMADEREPLTRAARLALATLNDDELATLAALARVGGLDAATDAITAISQIPPERLAQALERLCDLRLVEGGGDRYAIATLALRRILDRQLKHGTQRQRAAAFFAGAVALHIGDLGWLATEFSNLTAAIETSLTGGEAVQAGALARALQPLPVLRGYWGGWSRLIDWAEQAARAAGDRALEAWALHERGTRAGLLGDGTLAAASLDQARRLREALGDQTGAVASAHNLAHLGLLPPAAAISPHPPAALTRGLLAAVLLLLIAAGGWFALAPLFSAPPLTPDPTAPPSAIVGARGVATPDRPPTPAGASPVPSATATATARPSATVAAIVLPTPPTSRTPAPPSATALPSCRVVAARVNLRAGPGTVYPTVAQSLAAGTVLTPLARSPAGSWLSVQIQGTSRGGWVIAASDLLACNIPIAELPVGAIPPAPRPRPPATATPAPTATPSAAPTEAPAATITPTLPGPVPPTETLAPPTPTDTVAPPTATPTTLSVPVAAPTATPVPPTEAVPTEALAPTPTDTPAPPPANIPKRPYQVRVERCWDQVTHL